MGEIDSVEEIIEYAIAKELEAYELYMALSKRVRNPQMRKLLEELAKEELEHKAKLELEIMKAGKAVTETVRSAEAKAHAKAVVGEMMAAAPSELEQMDYEDMLFLGIKKEKLSFRLYIDLAQMVENAESREVLISLAEEEARHKVRFEMEYDEVVRKEK